LLLFAPSFTASHSPRRMLLPLFYWRRFVSSLLSSPLCKDLSFKLALLLFLPNSFLPLQPRFENEFKIASLRTRGTSTRVPNEVFFSFLFQGRAFFLPPLRLFPGMINFNFEFFLDFLPTPRNKVSSPSKLPSLPFQERIFFFFFSKRKWIPFVVNPFHKALSEYPHPSQITFPLPLLDFFFGKQPPPCFFFFCVSHRH